MTSSWCQVQAEHDKMLREIEQSHMVAAEHLEKTFDKRLELERQKLRVMQANKDDQQFRADEELERLKAVHAGLRLASLCRLQSHACS
jgi:hypothetical protein